MNIKQIINDEQLREYKLQDVSIEDIVRFDVESIVRYLLD